MTEIVKNAAEELAARMDRKRFVRKISNRLFMGFAVVTAGGGLSLLRSPLAHAVSACITPSGAGCPYGCGTSPSCTYNRSSGCDCGSNSNCGSGSAHCHGYASTWGGDACWTCWTSDWYDCLQCQCREYNLCCDCATSGCGDPKGYCISFASGVDRRCPFRTA